MLKSYRDKFTKKREMRVVGYGEINWNLSDDNGVPVPRKYSILFYENNLGERKYHVNAPAYEKNCIGIGLTLYMRVNYGRHLA